jgi:UDP-galactose transporter
MLGLGAAICAVLTSGLAGVLCEYLLKAGARHVTMSIRNVQLGVPSCLLGLVALHFQENEKLVNGGFFQGFTSWTWTVIVLHSLGGLLVTAVMKFADNLLKGFAMAASLVSACFFSVYFFHFVLTANFIFGALMVVLATFLYLLEDNFFGCKTRGSIDGATANDVGREQLSLKVILPSG